MFRTWSLIGLLAALCLPCAASAQEAHVVTKAKAVHLVDALYLASPDLSPSARIAISQDIHGAPLARAPQVHRLEARSILCRKRIEGHAPAQCDIDFGRDRTLTLRGRRGERLYKALGEAGVDDDSGMGHVAHAIGHLACSVDDRVAQNTPAEGDDVAGFKCQFGDSN